MNKDITNTDQKLEKEIIDNRQKDYGNFEENFALLAEMFTIILRDNLNKSIKSYQVGQIMMALKLFRSSKNFKEDNYLDLSIYNKMTKDLHKKYIDKKNKV